MASKKKKTDPKNVFTDIIGMMVTNLAPFLNYHDFVR